MEKIYYSEKLAPILLQLKKELERVFKNCKSIAIKIHFGSPGNDFSFKPEQIKPITDLLKELEINYFLYDTSVAYNGIRDNPKTHKEFALEKGWGSLGEIKIDGDFIKVKGKQIIYEVAKLLTEVDGVLVISHVKGHCCSGFGGAIKNLGMGALSKKSKGEIHSGGEPEILEGCTKCKACEKDCPIDCLKVLDKPIITKCYGCSNCCYSCEYGVLKPKIDYFDFLLAEGANAAQSKFKKKYYISFLNNITKLCDCSKNPEQIISEDVGFLISKDAVAIDNASRDLIIKKMNEDVFLKHNKKSGMQQIKYAESLEMGSSEYNLIEL
jgi:uncharacterized Fe-S center protein